MLVLPGPPRELQPMWEAAMKTDALRAALKDATSYRQRMLRLFGIPESEIAETLRVAAREGVELDRLEITTCLKRGEIEVVTRYEPNAERAYRALEKVVKARHRDTLFSEDGSTVDEQVAALLRGKSGAPRTIATAESCTGGLLAARLTEQAGASEYVKGGIVAYCNEVKVSQAGRGKRADRQARGGLGGGGGGARRRGKVAPGRGRGRGGDRRGRPGRRQRGEARGPGVVERRGGRRGA